MSGRAIRKMFDERRAIIAARPFGGPARYGIDGQKIIAINPNAGKAKAHGTRSEGGFFPACQSGMLKADRQFRRFGEREPERFDGAPAGFGARPALGGAAALDPAFVAPSYWGTRVLNMVIVRGADVEPLQEQFGEVPQIATRHVPR